MDEAIQSFWPLDSQHLLEQRYTIFICNWNGEHLLRLLLLLDIYHHKLFSKYDCQILQSNHVETVMFLSYYTGADMLVSLLEDNLTCYL